MRAGRIAIAIVAGLLSLVGFGALVGGAALIAIHATQRDATGFYQSPSQHMQTTTAALVTRVQLDGAGQAWLNHPLGTIRIEARSDGTGPVFVGIGPAAEVGQWLSGSGYTRVTQWGWGPVTTRTETVPGERPLTAPTAQRFWAVSAAGSGEQSVDWSSATGDWTVVVMNADGQPGLAVQVSVGSNTGLLLPAGIIAGVFGLVLLAGGVAATVIAVRRPAAAEDSGTEAGLAVVPGTYPVRLNGRLEPGLSRWLWVVKWFLAIPHYVLLLALWLAVVPLTAVAGLAILFTGRYPRSIFVFNVGVMRWTWRVSFYTFGALGTDRYPPFSLDSDPGYPADLAVDYPQRLSRGLVLVKWWLLAIPHYLVVALLVGAWTQFGLGNDRWWIGFGGGGLIGILVLVAAIALAVGGTYPVELFGLVMGFNRWCYRVLAYAGLMRDEYPPFRLDTGGTDPGSVPATPAPALPTGDPVGTASGGGRP